MVKEGEVKKQLKNDIGVLVKSIVDLSEKETVEFYAPSIVKISEEIDLLINEYYGIA